MPIRVYSKCLAQGSGFSRSMDPGAGRTWFCSSLQKPYWKGKPIDVFNYGKMQRDFTYIDDIIEGVVRVMDRIPEAQPAIGTATIPIRQQAVVPISSIT